MPELPDLLHVVATLRERLLDKHVTAERVTEPIVLRFLVRGNLSLLMGRRLADITRRAHFVIFRFEGLDLCVNPMLAGRFRQFIEAVEYKQQPTAGHEGSGQ